MPDEIKLEQSGAAWQAQLEIVLQSDRAAVDIGITALKTSMLINAGAAVALLAFIGQLWNTKSGMLTVILNGMMPFVWGVFASAVAAGVAYIYQSIVTLYEQQQLEQISEGGSEKKPHNGALAAKIGTSVLMIGLVIASYVLFISGVLSVIRALAQQVS